MTGKGLCGVCESQAQQACGGCGLVYYCSKEHQRKDWPSHRQECQPYKIVSTPEAGQYLIAGRPLKAGHCILKDTPLVVGPLSSSSLLCLGCFSNITKENFVKCPQCQWPLCSDDCATSNLHKDECLILARDKKGIGIPKVNEDTPRYDCILLIRCLLLKSTNLQAWEVLLKMASHVEQRMINKEPHHMTTVFYVSQILKVDFEADTVHQIRGAIATNAVEIPSEKGSRVRSLYPRIRLLNHSCAPNVNLTCARNQVMEARTATSVDYGAPLHICYTATTAPIWERQSNLHDSYYFTCTCQRCSDPTELGTYFSYPRCPQCKKLYMQKEETVWICKECKYEQCSSAVQENVMEAIDKFNESFNGSSYEKVVSVLDQAEKTYHPTHYVWMRVAQRALYKTLSHKQSLDILKLRRDIWIRLLPLYETFEPGLTRRRGMSLLETGSAILEAEVLEQKQNSCFSSQSKNQIELTVKYFREAAYILGLEHPDSNEVTLSRKAEEKRIEAEDILVRMTSGSFRAE
ncbi:hypothetical protein SK128_012616 [Halocaridina rubra]|uniref:MYND-type domain-containing protein n=1 Tax=Halocaridina rubra TaxID=373956 RepID=A0AAN9A395_HALRR